MKMNIDILEKGIRGVVNNENLAAHDVADSITAIVNDMLDEYKDDIASEAADTAVDRLEDDIPYKIERCVEDYFNYSFDATDCVNADIVSDAVESVLDRQLEDIVRDSLESYFDSEAGWSKILQAVRAAIKEEAGFIGQVMQREKEEYDGRLE